MMNVSNQEPEVPSKETSEKEVRESYNLHSNLHRLAFASNQNLHRKILLLKNLRIDDETDFIRPQIQKAVQLF